MEDTACGRKANRGISGEPHLRIVESPDDGRTFPLSARQWYAWKLFSRATGNHRHALIYVLSKRVFRGVEGPDILQLDYHDVSGLQHTDARADLYILNNRPGYLAGNLIYMTPPVLGSRAVISPVTYRWIGTAFPRILTADPPQFTAYRREPVQHFLNRVLW